MGTVRETAVSVRFGGVDLDPDEITRLLGVEPDLALRTGDPTPNGRGTRMTGIWSIRALRLSPGDLDGQIGTLLAKMSDDLPVWLELSRRYRADLFCGLFLEDGNEGITLSTETIRAIADRGLELGLDIYSVGSD
jgi:hypothetical protein